MNELKPPKIQAQDVNYELHSLGWKGFQNLCVTIMREVMGQTIQSFFDSHDGGRDGAFHGMWSNSGRESFSGSFTVQCKFTAKADKCIRLSDLKDEISKANRLASDDLAENYILFTNARLTGVSEEKICETFESIPGVKRFAAYGCDWISQTIRESSRLRMLVPRVYGLGDLSQIIDERAYNQAKEIISSLGDDLAKFVITEPYRKSAKALLEHGFVLLVGEPASGKTTIAALLAIGALDIWGYPTIKIRNADDFVKHYNPHESNQFFWVDDAFGETQFDWSRATGWNSAFPHLNAAIRRGTRVLFTSRDYIYRSAHEHLKEPAFPLIKESQVVIHVEDLTKDERKQILYNHIRLGTQKREFKTRLKPNLPGVAAHRRFSPETARRLGNPIFTKDLVVSENELNDFVAHSLGFLCEVLRTLDAENRSAIALVFIHGGILPSPVDITVDERRVLELLGGSPERVRVALNALNGSLLILTLKDGNYVWRFKHPTIRDAFATLISEDTELMDIYIAGTPIEKLFGEISCGDVSIEGVKVIVPVNRYDLLIERFVAFDVTKWENKRALHWFLAYRCDRVFLDRYIKTYTDFISQLNVGSYLYAVSDVDVILCLHRFDLLPELERQRIVRAIKDLAVDTPDAGFLSEQIRDILTPEELEGILEYVREMLLPDLDTHISNWYDNYSYSDDEPEGYFAELWSALKKYKEVFVNDQDAVAYIDNALVQLYDIEEELITEFSQEPDWEDDGYYERESLNSDDSRSIFDDVDQ